MSVFRKDRDVPIFHSVYITAGLQDPIYIYEPVHKDS